MNGRSGRRWLPVALLVVGLVVGLGPALAGDGKAGGGLEVRDVHFSGNKNDLVWEGDGEFYGVYRGDIRTGEAFAYDHICVATALVEKHAKVVAVPFPGRAYYYLVEAMRRAWSSGDLEFGGLDGPGAVRDPGLLACGERLYVDPNAPAGGDGSSWSHAYRTVTDALHHPHTRNRPFTLWILDRVIDSTAVVMPEVGARFLGGFKGGESVPWERDPAAARTDWPVDLDFDASAQGWMQKYLFDRIAFGPAIRLHTWNDGFGFYTWDCTFDKGGGITGSPPNDYCLGIELEVDRCEFEGGSDPSIQLGAEGDWTDVRIYRSTFHGSDATAVDLGFDDGVASTGSRNRVEILRNTISGGDSGIVIRADVTYDGNYVRYVGTIASNVISGLSGTGIDLACYDQVLSPISHPVVCRMDLAIVGNTIADNGGDGIACRLTGNTNLPPGSELQCQPRTWNNILAHNAGYGYREPPDSRAEHTFGDPEFVGNDLYGNGHAYLDEGTRVLDSVKDVNQLAEARDNWQLSPGFVGPGDYHLASTSPLIDRGQQAFPGECWVDLDGERRMMDGDGDGIVRLDIGADEVP